MTELLELQTPIVKILKINYSVLEIIDTIDFMKKLAFHFLKAVYFL